MDDQWMTLPQILHPYRLLVRSCSLPWTVAMRKLIARSGCQNVFEKPNGVASQGSHIQPEKIPRLYNRGCMAVSSSAQPTGMIFGQFQKHFGGVALVIEFAGKG